MTFKEIVSERRYSMIDFGVFILILGISAAIPGLLVAIFT